MTKKLLFIILLTLSIFGLVLWLGSRLEKESPTVVFVSGKRLQVEVAQTVTEKEQGLSNRPSLCSDCGLLFLFDQPGIYAFWMRKMRFDIDILWIKDNRVVDLTLGAKKPAETETDAPKTVYRSRWPVDKVLEVNAGWVEKNQVKIGDEINLKD